MAIHAVGIGRGLLGERRRCRIRRSGSSRPYAVQRGLAEALARDGITRSYESHTLGATSPSCPGSA